MISTCGVFQKVQCFLNASIRATTILLKPHEKLIPEALAECVKVELYHEVDLINIRHTVALFTPRVRAFVIMSRREFQRSPALSKK